MINKLFSHKSMLVIGVLIVLSMFTIIGLTGCSPQEAEPPAQEGETSDQEVETPSESDFEGLQLNFATMSPGGTFYTLSVAQAAIIEKHTGIMVTPQPATVSSGIPTSIQDKTAEIAICQSFDVDKAYRGKLTWEGQEHSSLRAIQSGHELQIGLFTTKDSGITKWEDLKGKRLADIVGAPTDATLVPLLLEYYGIKNEDLTRVPVEHGVEAFNALADRRVDAIITSVFVSTIEELSTRVDIIYIPITAETVDYIREHDISFYLTQIKYDVGLVEKGLNAVAIPVFTMCHEDLPDEVVYLWLKTLFDNYDELLSLNPDIIEDWSLERAVKKLPIPYHPGAMQYYKEVGLWDQEMEEHQSSFFK